MVEQEGGSTHRKGREGAWKVLSRGVLLRAEEFFIDAWVAHRQELQSGVEASEEAAYQYENAYGLLALTNQRVVFVAQRGEYDRNNPFFQRPIDPLFLKASSGCFSANYKERFCVWESFDLEDVESFQLRKGRMVEGLTLRLRWWHRGHPHYFQYDSLLSLNGFDEEKAFTMVSHKASKDEMVDSVALKEMLSEALRARWSEVAELMSKRREPIVMDFSTLRERLEQMGISFESVKCPSCGGAISLPVAGAKKTCEYCGSRIYAMQLVSRQ